MVDRNITDKVQDAANSARDAANSAQQYVGKGYDSAREYANKGFSTARDYANKGYDSAREYASTGIDVAARVGDNLGEFARREPWIAIAAAFAVGYVAARVMRRLAI
jgi:ElaB/YqjD/DUF883 family membrane-anchored ribosome-binding protein